MAIKRSIRHLDDHKQGVIRQSAIGHLMEHFSPFRIFSAVQLSIIPMVKSVYGRTRDSPSWGQGRGERGENLAYFSGLNPAEKYLNISIRQQHSPWSYHAVATPRARVYVRTALFHLIVFDCLPPSRLPESGATMRTLVGRSYGIIVERRAWCSTSIVSRVCQRLVSIRCSSEGTELRLSSRMDVLEVESSFTMILAR